MRSPNTRTFTLLIVVTLLSALAPSRERAVARPAAPPVSSPILTGRNCGGTVVLAGANMPGSATDRVVNPASATSFTWDEDADFIDGFFAQTEVVSGSGRVTLARRWTANVAVDGGGTSSQFGPTVAFAPDGEIYYAWHAVPARQNDFGDIFFSTVDTGPGQTRRSVRVDDTQDTVSNQFNPSLAITPAGTYGLAWTDQRRGGSDVFFAYSTNQGRTWSANKLVNNPITTLSHSNPFLLAGAQNTFYLVWQASGGGLGYIFFAQSTDGGLTWSLATRVHGSAQAPQRQNPALARLSDGTLIAAWDDNRNGQPQIFTSRRSPGAGQGWASDAPLDAASTDDQTHASLAVGAEDVIYLAFQQAVSGTPGIFFTRSTDGGLTWESGKQLNDGTASAIAPQLAVDSTGEPYCAWCEGRGNRDDIYAARSPNGGAGWTQPTRVNDTTGDGIGSPPAIAVDGAGNVQVAWSDGRNLPAEIYTARWPNAAFYTEGSYTAPVYAAQRSAVWQRLRWEVAQAAGTSVALEARTGNRASPDATWSDWVDLSASPADLSNLPPGRYLQWRASFTTSDETVTPGLTQVIVESEGVVFLPIVGR